MRIGRGSETRLPTLRLRASWVAGPIFLLNIVAGMLGTLFMVLNRYPLAEFLGGLPGPLLAFSFSAVGALVAARRSRNPVGWIFLAVGFSQGLVSFAYQYAEYALITAPGSLPGGPAMSVVGQLAWIPGLSLLLTYALLLFPDGRLPSQRWRPVAWLSAGPLILFVPLAISSWPFRGRALLENPEQYDPEGVLAIFAYSIFPLMLLCGLACVASLVVRFRRSRGVERQQLKWFTFAAAVFLTVLVVGNYLDIDSAASMLLVLPAVPSIPIAAGIAILRYRLYEIDILINRTLVYVSLTAALVLVYLGCVVLLQSVFRALTGQESQLAVVASTLAIAAMFSPLRRRIQSFIDRRFYRSKYDAARTLEAFGARLRDEVELESLTGDLVGVVRETVQPEHVLLWLRNPDGEAER